MYDVKIRIDEIYVPTKRRAEIDSGKVLAIAESMLEVGQQVPISVRRGKDRYVLVTGLQRLEACRELGEATIIAVVTSAPQH